MCEACLLFRNVPDHLETVHPQSRFIVAIEFPIPNVFWVPFPQLPRPRLLCSVEESLEIHHLCGREAKSNPKRNRFFFFEKWLAFTNDSKDETLLKGTLSSFLWLIAAGDSIWHKIFTRCLSSETIWKKLVPHDGWPLDSLSRWVKVWS